MNMPTDKIIVDLFAGGGGASEGIYQAIGRHPDVAINHDPIAIAMHKRNHPETEHYCNDIWAVDPVSVRPGMPIGLLWASPDCKHFSKAKGGKPLERAIRDLAWVVVDWAEKRKPDLIFVENVEEFKTWGPLYEDGSPIKELSGQTFEDWIARFKKAGYKVEYRESRAFQFGAPTIRRRLCVIASRIGKPVWPKATHGDPKSDEVISGKLKPWLTAGDDVIDWSIPCPSIFDTKAEIKAKFGLQSQRPLADNTQARVARGIGRYVLKADRPFLVNLTHGARLEDVAEPMRTVTRANRGEKAVVSPTLANVANSKTTGRGPNAWSVEEPVRTVTASPGFTVVAPSLTRFNSGATGAAMDEPAPTVTANSFHKRPGGAAPLGVVAPVMTYAQQGGSVRDPGKPLHTVTASDKDVNSVIAASLTAYYGKGSGGDDRSADPASPLHTVVTENRHAPVAAYLAQHNGNGVIGRAADVPAATILQAGSQTQVVATSMLSLKGSDRRDSGAHEPARTVCAGGNHAALISAHVTRQFGKSVGHDAGSPTGAITAGVNKTGIVAGALTKYYGTDQDPRLDEPLHTVTTKDRFNLTEMAIAAPPFGPEHVARARETADFLRAHGEWDDREFVTIEIGDVTMVMVDIGMRMLVPRELFKAQGFRHDYEIEADADGNKFTKSNQVGRAGNSVSPPWAAAHIRANAAHLIEFHEAAE